MTAYIEALYWLCAGHAFGDWVFQTALMGSTKAHSLFFMAAHCLVYSACVGIALKHTGRYAFWKVLFLFAGHFVIDSVSSAARIWGANQSLVLIIDQAFHFVQLLIVSIGREE